MTLIFIVLVFTLVYGVAKGHEGVVRDDPFLLMVAGACVATPLLLFGFTDLIERTL